MPPTSSPVATASSSRPGAGAALLLPQVATEMGWGAVDMLAAVCEKAGLQSDAWLEPATRLSVFEVVHVDGPLVPA